MLLFYFFNIPILIIAWAMVFPLQVVVMIENIKQCLDRYVIGYIARKDAHLLREQFRKWGELNGFEGGLIEDVLDKHASKILQRLEIKYSGLKIEELI